MLTSIYHFYDLCSCQTPRGDYFLERQTIRDSSFPCSCVYAYISISVCVFIQTPRGWITFLKGRQADILVCLVCDYLFICVFYLDSKGQIAYFKGKQANILVSPACVCLTMCVCVCVCVHLSAFLILWEVSRLEMIQVTSCRWNKSLQPLDKIYF